MSARNLQIRLSIQNVLAVAWPAFRVM